MQGQQRLSDEHFCKTGRPCSSNTCAKLGVPVAQEKCEGPATTLTYLGIEIDLVAMELCLPVDKLRRIREKLANWMGRKASRRRELESLPGLLKHAAKIVKLGRGLSKKFLRS